MPTLNRNPLQNNHAHYPTTQTYGQVLPTHSRQNNNNVQNNNSQLSHPLSQIPHLHQRHAQGFTSQSMPPRPPYAPQTMHQPQQAMPQAFQPPPPPPRPPYAPQTMHQPQQNTSNHLTWNENGQAWTRQNSLPSSATSSEASQPRRRTREEIEQGVPRMSGQTSSPSSATSSEASQKLPAISENWQDMLPKAADNMLDGHYLSQMTSGDLVTLPHKEIHGHIENLNLARAGLETSKKDIEANFQQNMRLSMGNQQYQQALQQARTNALSEIEAAQGQCTNAIATLENRAKKVGI